MEGEKKKKATVFPVAYQFIIIYCRQFCYLIGLASLTSLTVLDRRGEKKQQFKKAHGVRNTNNIDYSLLFLSIFLKKKKKKMGS